MCVYVCGGGSGVVGWCGGGVCVCVCVGGDVVLAHPTALASAVQPARSHYLFAVWRRVPALHQNHRGLGPLTFCDAEW